MKNLLFVLVLAAFFSCSKDPVTTSEALQGTWLLTEVSGSCASIPVSGTANEQGCIDNPVLEVNCSIIEFLPDGQLNYAYALVKGSGSYTIDGDGVTICTDRCLDYTVVGNSLELQTGTIASCDPIYTFQKGVATLDELITQHSLKRIKRVTRNGLPYQQFTYNTEGYLEQSQSFDSNGNLRRTEVLFYTPLTTTRTITDLSDGKVRVTNSFFEAPGRLRVDYLDGGELDYYWLYFYDTDYDCSYSRAELYGANNALWTLRNVVHTGNSCNTELTDFTNGEKVRVRTLLRDDQRPWSAALGSPLLPARTMGNVLSNTTILSDGTVSGSSYTATYTYDEAGYPITAIFRYTSGTDEAYIYEYE